MNTKYFITAFATFASISIAQGASFMTAQKLVQGVSFNDFLLNEKVRSSLDKVFQERSPYLDNDQWKVDVELVPVSSSSRKRGSGSGGRSRRPTLSRGPMSF
ncbi:hypothetical protein HNQ69_000538 [Bartonella callosciuri]|uniref:Uncharacterized protein n=1 Tax=Bartonella callosciuri TaxID=686223 RepID=A0A840NZC0_9HYPH|nr:hypothetical protein [Bartonella callosciuri]MBB5073417.1 hypothetical protein [Bartonella callosciuri]